MKAQNTVQNILRESKPGRVIQCARRIALSAPGKFLLAVAIVIGLLSIPLLTKANDPNGYDGNEKRTLTGNWLLTTTRLDPLLPGQAPTFLSLYTYFDDGNLLYEANNSDITGTGRGRWERTGHQQFVNSFIFFRYDAARKYLGTIQPTSTITLSEDGSEYHADTVAQVYDAAGNFVRTAHLSAFGRRL